MFQTITDHYLSTGFFFKDNDQALTKARQIQKNNFKEEKLNRICILGPKKAGKSFILSQIFDSDNKEYYKDSEFVYKKVNNVLFVEPIQGMNNDQCKKAIANSSIILYVVRNYGYKEQKQIKNILSNGCNKTIIIIHNSFAISEIEIRTQFQNYSLFLDQEAKWTRYMEATDQSHIFREKDSTTNIFHFFLMNNYGYGEQYNIEIFNDITAVIGVFLSLGNKYVEEAKNEDTLKPKYEVKKDKENVEIIVDLPCVKEVTAGMEIKNDEKNGNIVKFSLKGEKIIDMGKNPIIEKIKKGTVSLEVNLPYNEYLISNTEIDEKNNYGRVTFKFPLLCEQKNN